MPLDERARALFARSDEIITRGDRSIRRLDSLLRDLRTKCDEVDQLLSIRLKLAKADTDDEPSS